MVQNEMKNRDLHAWLFRRVAHQRAGFLLRCVWRAFVDTVRLTAVMQQWERCAPSAQQLHAQRLATQFASAQADASADVEGGWDAEGGWDDDDTTSEASWDDEAWNEPGA